MIRLDKKIIEDVIALTALQEGMLYHYLEDREGSQYFEQLSLEISGEIDARFFEQAWNFVVETNEALRTRFRWEKVKKPVQILLKHHRLEIKRYDFSRQTGKSPDQLIDETKREDRSNKFDLQEVPFRVTLCKLKENKYLVLISQHHILYDGWSTGIILKEFLEAYHNLVDGKPLIKKEKGKFKEFVKWSQSRDKSREESYWRDYLKAFATRTPLPIKKSEREKEADVQGEVSEYDKVKRCRCKFPDEFSKEVRTFVKEQEITLASLLYSAWGILLQKYTGSYDVLVGTTVAGRNARVKDVENIVGLFINTIPLRVKGEADTTVSALLGYIHGSLQVREAFENSSLVDIKKNSEPDGKESLFDTILVIENYPLDKVITTNGNHFSIDSYSMFYLTNYDLTVAIGTFNAIDITFTHRGADISDPAVKRLTGHFEVILREMMTGPDKTVRELDMLTPAEREQLLLEFNDSAKEYSLDKTLQRLFEEQAERTPGHAAVVSLESRQHRLIYSELNQKSNQLARLLRKNGVTAETVVGIMMEPCTDMIVSLLAILKAAGDISGDSMPFPCRTVR